MEQNLQIAGYYQLATGVKQLDKADKVTVIVATNKYVNAKRACGDVQTAYQALLGTLEVMSKKYGVKLIDSNCNVKAVIDEFAAKVEQGTNALTGGRSYTCTFKSLNEANAWLNSQPNLLVKDFSVSVSRVGLDVESVQLVYVVSDKPFNRKFQICEVMKHRFFVSSKHEKFRSKWEADNPQYNYVKSLKYKWHFSLIGGSVGFFRYIKEKYVVLYTF